LLKNINLGRHALVFPEVTLAYYPSGSRRSTCNISSEISRHPPMN
jgi:hypothetical protein